MQEESGSRTSEMDAEILSAEEEYRKEEIGLSKNQYMDDMAGNWWKATMEGRTEKLAAIARGSRSRAPKMEAERLPAEVVPALKEEGENILPMEEAVEVRKVKKSKKSLP